MHKFISYIYVQPVWNTFFGFLLLVILYPFAILRLQKNGRAANAVVFALAVLGILYATIFHRTTGTYSVSLIPFESFAKEHFNQETVRAFLMNALLFVPFGMSSPFLLPKGVKYKKTVVVLVAVFLSAAIEYAQFHYQIGNCQIDDVIMNTLGAAIGTVSYGIWCSRQNQ